MAASRGTLTYLDGSEHRITLTTGDKLRAQREANKKDGAIGGGEPAEVKQEVTLFAVYLAAKRTGLPATDKDFLGWADEVAEFDTDITHELIDTAVAMGEMTEKQAEILRKRVKDDDAQGEAGATPAS